MSDSDVPHMSTEAFRQHGYALIDWVARYLETVHERPVRAPVAPGEIQAQLPGAAPEFGEPFEALLRDLDEIVVPGLTHWQHPGFFAYFPANVSAPSILAELVSAGLGVQGMLWQTSPACTEVETRVLDWMIDLLALPDRFRSTGAGGGVIQDTASSATLCALLAARERATEYDAARVGATPPGAPPLRAYTTAHAHSSVAKAMMIAGLGRDHLVTIESDDAHAMRPVALAAAIARDRAAGYRPFFCTATIGTTSSHAIDPIADIAAVCAQESIWLHVDAAHAGPAALCPEFRWIHDGIEHADSYCFNPHKWMLTNFDCNCFYVADRRALLGALSISPEYLRNEASESGAVFDYRDWHIPLGRRFRALKLWWVLRSYGVSGMQAHIREHVAAARWFTDFVRRHPQLELAVEPPLTLVCFRHSDGDAASEALLERLNASGRLYLTHTRLHDRYVLRLAIGGARQTMADVRAAAAMIDAMTESPID